ncbi:MAG: hypothetical protein KAH25_13050 [Bacteroidales bacterium]|nr:hypothetical protein [Bacteroidales bacterium]
MRNTYIYTFLGLLLLFALTATKCNKNEEPPLPFAVVNIRIEPNSTQFINLNSVGGHEYLTADLPSRGVVVYRIGVNDFKAFERTCPHDPNACCDDGCSRLYVEEDGIIIKDDCCGSTYLILDGSNVAGPSVRPLKEYFTSYNGKILHIYN